MPTRLGRGTKLLELTMIWLLSLSWRLESYPELNLATLMFGSFGVAIYRVRFGVMIK